MKRIIPGATVFTVGLLLTMFVGFISTTSIDFSAKRELMINVFGITAIVIAVLGLLLLLNRSASYDFRKKSKELVIYNDCTSDILLGRYIDINDWVAVLISVGDNGLRIRDLNKGVEVNVGKDGGLAILDAGRFMVTTFEDRYRLTWSIENWDES